MQAPVAQNRLRELRLARDLKLYDLASTLRVDPSTIHRWEQGDTAIPDEHKLALAEMFGVSVLHLMRWPESKAAA